MLQLKRIVKDYQAGDQVVRALNGVSMDFRKSEFVSVLGPSGCGKTTLMNIVGGLDKATEGDLVINGKSTKDFKDGDWDNYRNKKIGFVFQNYYLIPHLSILANVELSLTIAGLSKSERSKRAKDALIQVGLSDKINKKPNQLSGGQMQRVAIARALVNAPEILLADEPTGALDTKTSEQILELIKEISQEKLVIMVTHNSELAERYSTRIIRMLDGEITDDSAPYNCEEDIVFTTETEQLRIKEDIAKQNKKAGIKIKNKSKDKTSMSFFTALSLSCRNLLTKKGRTVITSIAGSIGIIGIALILAVSSGMNSYVTKTLSDTMATDPLTISRTGYNISEMMNMSSGSGKVFEKYPSVKKVFTEELEERNVQIKNNITAEYISYLDANIQSQWVNDLVYDTGIDMNFYGIRAGESVYSDVSSGNWQQLLKSSFVNTQYDVLAGDRLPSAKNELVLVVDESNVISENRLINLGLKAKGDGVEEYTFDELMAAEFKILTNDQSYSFAGSSFAATGEAAIDFDAALTLKIVSIIRINKSTESGVLSTGIGYTKELKDWLLEENMQSEIVTWMNNNPTKNPFTGSEYRDIIYGTNITTAAEQRESALRGLGGLDTVDSVRIYPVSYDAKESIKGVLNAYNVGKDEADQIIFNDVAEIFGATISRMVNTITYVLIAFTAISLIVSSVMIGIITYVSVIERTKEIGILRSIGARKKDVSRVFNAETFIIGFGAGLIGVIVAYLLSIPINLIISSLVGVTGIASLSPLSALALVAISICLTLISGLIPSRMAAKKDPVLALRTE